MEENDNSAAWAMISQNAATTAINAAETRKGRKWQEEQMQIDREWQEEMYQRQLDDSIDWNREQREYNSIGAQMQRYRDAGINPMYAVTGKGGDQVVQPFSASSGGFKTSTPSAYQGKSYNLDFGSAIQLQNQTKIANAQAASLQAQAEDHQASALLKKSQTRYQDFENELQEALKNISFSDYDPETGTFTDPANYYEIKAYAMTSQAFYADLMNKYNFYEMKKVFLENDNVRAFATDLREQQRKLFYYELEQANSYTEILKVTEKWAEANQWINAGAKVVGAGVGLVNAAKGAPVTNVTKTTHVYDPTTNIQLPTIP